MPEAKLPQGTISYRDSGEGGPVLFVHGLLVNGRLWDPVIDRLSSPSAAGHRCIAPHLPLGSHPAPLDPGADLSPHGVTRMLGDLMDELGLERVTLVGNDSGGAISQLLATTQPNRVGRLILTNCDMYEDFPPKLFAYFRVIRHIPGGLAMMAQTMRIKPLRRTPIAYGVLTKSRLPDELLDAWLEPSINSAEIRRDTLKFIRGVDPSLTVEAARLLGSFEAPTLFAWAPEDRWFKIADAERLAASMPDARVVRIPDAKTFVSLDQPDRLAEAIGAFVAETKAGV